MKKIVIAIVAIIAIAAMGIGCYHIGSNSGYSDGLEDGLNDAFDIIENAKDEGMIAIKSLN